MKVGPNTWVVVPSEGHVLLRLQAGHEHAVMVAWIRPACSERLGVEGEPGSQALLCRAWLLTVRMEFDPELLTSSQRVHSIPRYARGRPKECSTVGYRFFSQETFGPKC